jgi:hypothetical protein
MGHFFGHGGNFTAYLGNLVMRDFSKKKKGWQFIFYHVIPANSVRDGKKKVWLPCDSCTIVVLSWSCEWHSAVALINVRTSCF